MTQYFDALKDVSHVLAKCYLTITIYGTHPFILFICTQIGMSGGSKTIFLPSENKNMQQMFRDGVLEGNAALI